MNNIESSPSGRLTTRAQQVAARAALKHAILNFPSYLRVSHVFPADFSSALRWRSAPFRAGLFGRLAMVPARVAIV